MNILKSIYMCLVYLSLSINGIANADTVIYTINGNLTGTFFPVSGDPIADLLNVPRNANNSVPFNLKLVIDTNDIPYVENDTSILQQVIYRDAIMSGELDLNGIKFTTVRQPLPFASDTPPASNTPFDESRINITNSIDPAGVDFFRIRLGPNPQATTDLFNNFTVSFMQTINGIFYDNTVVILNDITFSIPSAIGFLDGTEIPAKSNSFNPLPLFSGVNIFLSTDLNGFVQLAHVNGLGIGDDFTFNVTQSSDPVSPTTQAVPLTPILLFLLDDE